MPTKYRPADHETRIRERWEASGAFHADPGRVLRGEAKPYSIVIPPPNVTDRLHLGHALNNTLQDVLVRVHRMRGFETLWMPGTDHAGIATQAVVERRLRAEGKLKGPLRESMKREEFVAVVQAFKDEYEATITGQLKAMGCSCDWARQRFTMDEQCVRAVYEAFFRLFKDGLIYRGKRLVNWDPVLQTAVADDECEDVEVDGNFYYLRYPLVHGAKAGEDAVPVTWSELRTRGWPNGEDADHADEKQAWVTVATTRPETYLGDTAVGVNPKDPRATALRGLSVELPLVGRIIPIIEDAYVVMPRTPSLGEPRGGASEGSDTTAIRARVQSESEPEDPKAKFATGFLKVTPAHDPNDYEIGQRHQLPLINVFAPDAKISDKHGWTDVGDAHIFVGLPREEARKKVVMEFKARGLCEKVVPYRHSVKHSDRSKAAIEPYLSDQWYAKVTDDRMKGAALRAMASSSTPSRGTGVPPVTTPPTAFSSSSASSLSDPARPTGVPERLTITARNLPHWQRGGCSYFITFCLVRGTLSPAERKLVLDACRHWDGQRMELHAAVVMPDHAHLILSPFEKSPDVWWPLSEIMHSIKSFTSHEIGKARGERGQIWQDESHDRLIRDNEYADTMAYVLENPVKAGLVRHWLDYPFTWTTDEARAGRLRFAERVRGPQFPGEAERRKQEEEKAGEGVGTGGTPVPRAESRKAEAGDGDLRFHPDRYAKTYQAWHEGIRDWCISRQLWWGHRIPVWHKKCRLDASTWSRELAPQAGPSGLTGPTFGDMIMGVVDEMDVRFVRADTGREVDPTRMVPLESGLEGEYDVFVCPRTDVDATKWQLEKAGFTRDPDVLDTWFSSALWPTSTMGWPDDTDLLRAFNPTDVLCTAREIITLWVSRMVMFERYLMPEDWADRRRSTPGDQQLTDGRGRGPLPFRDVFIHAMIQDGEGRKMSKSLGNGVDPLDIIASHGADAMRFTLCNMATHTQDVRMPVEKDPATGRNTSPKFDLGRNLCNKLWNAARFALGILEARDERTQSSVLSPQSCSLVDRWMLSRLAAGVAEINGAVERYEFAAYAQAVYDLLWRDFCDWYLEAIKPTAAANPAQRAVLAHALEVIVRVLHPIAPFVTEAIWERLSALQTPPIDGISLGAARKTGLLCTAGWPEVSPSLRDTQAEQQFERIRGLITAVREVRAMHNVPPKRKVLLHTSPELDAECRRAGDLVETLAVLERVTPADPVGSAVPFVFEGVRCHLSNLADAVDAGAERKRLEKIIADADKTIKTLEGRLSNPGYADKAPAAMVQQTRDQLAKARAEREAAARALERVA